jgi:serine/threonine protein kinase
MGTVYEAVQGGLERRVALKVLSQKLCHDQPFILRFQQEARAAACLDHPNIVQVYEISQDRGRLFFSMQYVEGESLLARVKQNGPLPLEEALDILVQVVYALDYAFQRGIIHRDVKPDNILLTKDGTVKVADLGLAKSLFEPVGLTATGAGLGSPHYMAPEQGRGEKDLGCQADIYSLGITFFVTLTGMRPYGGKSPLDVMMAHIRNPLPSACRYRPELPTEVDEVIGRMAAKAREHRYPDYQSLLADLEMLRRKAHPSRGIRNPFSPVVSGFRRTCARIPVPALVVTIAVCLLCIGFLMARKPLRPWGRSARSDAEPSSASTTNGPVSVLGSGGEHSDSSTFSELVQPNGHVRRDGADTAPPASFGTARKDNPLVLEPLPLKPQSASGDERGDEEPSDGSSGPSDTFVDPTSAGAQGATRMRNSGERARSTQGRPSPGVESVHAQLSGGPGAPSIGLLPQIEPVGGKSRGSAPKKRREPQELPANHEMVFAGKAFRFGVPLPLAGTMEFDIRCPRRATGERYTVFSLDGRPGFAVGIEKHGALFASRLVPGSSQEISVGRQIRTVADGQWHKVRIEYGQGAEKAAVDRSGDSERSLPFLSTGEYGHLVFNPGREMA